MAHKLFQFQAFLSYWLDAVDEHSLHSPFFFDFYTRLVRNKEIEKGSDAIEKLRNRLLRDTRPIATLDLGSRRSHAPRTIAAIARTSLTPPFYCSLYARMIRSFKAKTVIELGTSFGINTLYLAQQANSQVTTFEGSPEIAGIARDTFDFAASRNIRLVQGNLDHTLNEFLQSVRKVDFALIDANHRYDPTLLYFHNILTRITETSVLVIDDIHYSKDMQKAWNEIKSHKLVYGTADLFRCGIVFFDPSLNKQHVILQV